MRDKIIRESVNSVLTISKIKKGQKFYAEQSTQSTMIASSPFCSPGKKGGIVRRLITPEELDGVKYTVPKKPTFSSRMWAKHKVSQHATIARLNSGEKTYVLYEAKADNQKFSVESSIGGTIIGWNAGPLQDGEKFDLSKSAIAKSIENRPHGILITISGAFFMGELGVKITPFSTGDMRVKVSSGTSDRFQKVSGKGVVYFEAKGSVTEIPLYPYEEVDVWPGKLFGYTEGIKLRMKVAGDVYLRNVENNDYVINLKAGKEGGFVYAQSISSLDKNIFNKK